jgi:UDP-N-acetylmuramoyl-L-alanyl-D-glutamate--2,6-diaminopimelate ligase
MEISMKISELIFENEIIYSTADSSLEITDISREGGRVSGKTLLFILKSNAVFNFPNGKVLPAAVVSDGLIEGLQGIPQIIVDNPREIYAKVCSRFFGVDYSKFSVIGVTGTNGKTTTASLIVHILRENGHRVGYFGTGRIDIDGELLSDKYYSMTTPDPELLYLYLKKMELASCSYVVMEVSSHALALEKVAPIPFEYAVFTNLSEEHLDFHGSMEEYYLSKKKLLEGAVNAVINLDDAYGRRLVDEISGRRVSVGALYSADINAKEVENLGFDGIRYVYKTKKFLFRMSSPLAGIYNVYNTMLAAATCADIGILPYRVKESIADFSGVAGRFEIIRDKITVIIDYAHTEKAFASVLKSIRSATPAKNRLTVVFGCGGERDREKRPKMARVSEIYADRTIVTEDNSRGEDTMDIISDVISGFKMGAFEICRDRECAIELAILSADDGDTVAILGKGAEGYIIKQGGYTDYSDRDAVLSALKKRGDGAK